MPQTIESPVQDKQEEKKEERKSYVRTEETRRKMAESQRKRWALRRQEQHEQKASTPSTVPATWILIDGVAHQVTQSFAEVLHLQRAALEKNRPLVLTTSTGGKVTLDPMRVETIIDLKAKVAA